MEIARLLLEIVVAVLVVARGSRFGADDILAGPFRMWVVRRTLPAGVSTEDVRKYGLLARGVHCRWCWSVWVGSLFVPVWYVISPTPHVWDRWYVDLPAVVLALSQGAALVQRLEPED